MEKGISKQLTLFIALLAIIWVLLLAIQIHQTQRLYRHRKDLIALQLNTAFDDAFNTTDTIDYESIDSLVNLSLLSHAVLYNIKYDLGVYSENKSQWVYLTENADTDALVKKGFRYNLFRVNGEETSLDVIMIHFPSLVKRLRLESIMSYSVIGILFILLLCCFINFFFIILQNRKINAFREKMAHFIVHELKTPLTTINLSTQLLKDKTVVTDEETKNTYLDMIAEETKFLEDMVEEVLTVFRAKSMPIAATEEVKLHVLLQEVCRVHATQLEEFGAELSFECDAEFDTVQGNYTHLFNAFSNLVDNAIKYRNGKLELTISTQNHDDMIEIRIADNGIGISEEQQKLVFEPFTRFHTDDSHYVKGFGLGLEYVKHVIDYHKGTILVDSELGKGTVFTISLPLKN